MARRRRTLGLWSLGVSMTLVALLVGCSKAPLQVEANRPPETHLSIERVAADSLAYEIRATWCGDDQDGRVVSYLVCLDSRGWTETTRTESLLLIPIEEGPDAEEVTIHSLSVVAVDDYGEKDPSPAVAMFARDNLLPDTEITGRPWDIVTGAMVFFEWVGWDYDGAVIGYGYRLSVWDDSLEVWNEVEFSETFGPEDLSMWLGPLDGHYMFEVWSRDDAGATDPTPAAWEFWSLGNLDGPRLYLWGNVIVQQSFWGHPWSESSGEPVDIFEGQNLTFHWSASAYGYNGEVLGYSVAFDDTTEWGDDYLPDARSFSVTPDVGEHCLYVAAKDNANQVTRGRVCFNVIEATLDQYILVVDDYDFREHQELWGTDEARDAFYDTLTADCMRPTLQWVPEEHLVGGEPQPPDVTTLAGASTVVWYVDSDYPVLGYCFEEYDVRYDRLGGYLHSGGNLILCGLEGLQQILGDTYPFALSESDTSMAEVFVRDYLGIGYADHSGGMVNKDAPWSYGYCFYGAVPGATGIPGPRVFDLEPMYIDSVGVDGFPEPGKWPLYTYIAIPNYTRCGLNVEKLVPYEGGPMEPYVIDSFLNMTYEGETCSILKLTGSEHGNACYFGFPLYYLQTQHVKAVFDELLPMMGEPQR